MDGDLDAILDQHDRAFAAFRRASDAFDSAVGSVRVTLAAMQEATHAQGEAIDAMREANQAALRLLRRRE